MAKKTKCEKAAERYAKGCTTFGMERDSVIAAFEAGAEALLRYAKRNPRQTLERRNLDIEIKQLERWVKGE